MLVAKWLALGVLTFLVSRWEAPPCQASVSPEARVKSTEFFVSPRGNDAWSGTLPDPDSAGNDGPFATLVRAQQAARQSRAEDSPVTVTLREGTYFLDAPLVLTAADSGEPASYAAFVSEEGAPMIYRAYPGERPMLSGGRPVAGWHEERIGNRRAWVTTLADVAAGRWAFRQLFVNGSRRMRPRLPKTGFYRIAELPGVDFESGDYQRGTDRFIYAPGDLRPWRNLQDVEITVHAFWNPLFMKLKALDETKRLAILDRNSEWRMSDDFEWSPGVYYVENVFEALDEPGEWYLDRPTGTLYYLPLPGEELRTAEIVAPRLAELVRVEGTAEQPAQAIQFEGLTFAHTEWQLPPDRAMPGWQAAVDLPAAVTVQHAQEIGFSQCRFQQLGTYAIELTEGCADDRVVGCTMRDLGGGGVKIGDGCAQNQVTDCEIGPIGLLFPSSVGVFIGHSSGNQVLHNHIHHLFYSGITVGFMWGYGRSDTYGNVIEYNHIHDYGQGMLSDFGGIYTLGPAPGTRIRFNLIHDAQERGYGSQGIYLDEGSSDILVENNLIYNCESGASETGRDNIFHNNIFALNRRSAIRPAALAAGGHRALTFDRNIVYFTAGEPIYTGEGEENAPLTPENAEFRGNLYFDASDRPMSFRGRTFPEWQRSGMDADSLIADPLFVDPEHGDFRLRPESPVLALGFREFDLSRVGPRPGAR